MVMFEEQDLEDKEGNTKSPIGDKPYVEVTTQRFDGAPVALPGEVIQIMVRNLERNMDVVIYLDNTQVIKSRTNDQGVLKLEVRAPREFGLHSITIRSANDEKYVIDGTMFLVKHNDDFKRRRRP